MSSDYFLRSARVGFRRWTASDFSLANELWGDPAVTRLIGGPFTEEQVRSRLSHEIETQNAYGIQYWPIFLFATGQQVGCCGLRPRDADRAIYEIGFHIRKSEWRKGYALEAARAVIAYAFDSMHAAALFAGHNPANESSRRILHKLGFCFTHTEYYAPTGLDHASYIFTRDAFAADPERSS